jgi:hypothetical protein
MNYDNINELNMLMHDFLYDKNTQENYVYEKTNINDITLSDIVKNDNFDYSVILNNSVGHKMNFKLIDAIDSKLILKKYFQNYPLTIIIQKHKEELNNTKNIIDIYYGLFMIQIIMEYRLLNNIPFYLLNICNFNIYHEDLTKDYLDVINSTFDDDKNARYCFSIFEHYNSYETIEKFLSIEQSNENIKLLLFQILFSYALLLYKLNNFRHNNFTIHSFLIEKLNEEQNISLSIGDFNMKIKTNFIVKLFDFRKSQIADYSNNIDCINDNPTFDIYTLFNSLYELKNINHDKITKILENFIDIEHIIKKYTNEQLFTKQLITLNPINILTKNNFFNVFMDTANLMSLSLGGFNSDIKPSNKKVDKSKKKVKELENESNNDKSKSDEETESNDDESKSVDESESNDDKSKTNESEEESNESEEESNESEEESNESEEESNESEEESNESEESDVDESEETESDVDESEEESTGGNIETYQIPTEKLNKASKLKIEKLRNTIKELKLKIGGKKNKKKDDSLSSLSSTESEEQMQSPIQQMPQQNVFGNYRPPQMALTERQMREQEYANQLMQQPMQMMEQPMQMRQQSMPMMQQPMPMMQQPMQMMQQPMMMDQYLQNGGKAKANANKTKKQQMPVVKDNGLFFLNR